MGSVFSAIGNLLNALINAIAKILTTVVSAVFTVLVTIIDLLEFMVCCRCFGSRSEDSLRSRRRQRADDLAASSAPAKA
ncbi:hypothetical protein C8R45DRAFT_1025655 [Mycena sanguinolenta]|nr:hypothetical protein C8R45DRAFT_1025655 [Mycena sanguinolenta]